MTKIAPRILPRTFPDFLLTFLAATILILILFVLPYKLLWVATNNYVVTFVPLLMVVLYFVFGGVRFLEINSEGIRFKRVLGSPKLIEWRNLEGVEISSPLRTIWFGWLWPIIPAREMTCSVSSYNHVLFRYSGNKMVFFPPYDIELLFTCIQKHKPTALSAEYHQALN
jgi:hypothetical protein